MEELNFQYLSDSILENESIKLQFDFTTLEQLKIATNLLNLINGDICFNYDEPKIFNTLTTICSQLKEIIEEIEFKKEN